MKKLLLAFAAAILLSSCNNETQGSDGYRFEQNSQRLSPERAVKVVLYPNIAAVKTAFSERPNARTLSPNEELQAFSVIGSKTCTIHMVDPAKLYQPEFFGHELVHCLYGEFHPTQNER